MTKTINKLDARLKQGKKLGFGQSLPVSFNASEISLDKFLIQEGLLRKYEDGKLCLSVKGHLFTEEGGYSGRKSRNQIDLSLRKAFWIANIVALLVSTLNLYLYYSTVN